jgi:hypothetical protein
MSTFIQEELQRQVDQRGEISTQNLAIENSFDSFKGQRFKYLSATSQFLPDIKTGYSLVGDWQSAWGAFRRHHRHSHWSRCSSVTSAASKRPAKPCGSTKHAQTIGDSTICSSQFQFCARFSFARRDFAQKARDSANGADR